MPGRKYSIANTNYRFGFDGQEKSDEIKGKGNSYTADFWEYDPRIGRRWNKDPAIKAFESSYAAFANNPVWLVDQSGADTTLPSADGGKINLPNGVSDIKTFDAKAKYTVAGKQINPASGSVLGFTYNNVNFTAQYNTKDASFAYYLGTDGSKLGYDINSIPSNIQFTGSERLATAGMIGMTVPRTPGLNDIPPAYLVGYGIAAGAALSSLYHWKNVSNDISMTKPLPFSIPVAIPFAGPANSIDNSNPHMVYEIYQIQHDQTERTLKYGITDFFSWGLQRPEVQIAGISAMYGSGVSWKPKLFTPNNASARAAEQALVDAYWAIHGEPPPLNFRPKPSQLK